MRALIPLCLTLTACACPVSVSDTIATVAGIPRVEFSVTADEARCGSKRIMPYEYGVACHWPCALYENKLGAWRVAFPATNGQFTLEADVSRYECFQGE